jgi:CubicO group peptidase (beta-lactamase class C family)/ketosteroid isomerase-like protein
MERLQLLLPLLGVLGLLPPAGASEADERPSGSSGSLEARVDAYLAPYLARRDFSGAILIARGDKVLLRKAYGMASYELAVPNTPDTEFRIASLTKTFTAAAVVMLQEQGRLSFDDRLSKFLPDFPSGEKITVLHLLRHEGGVPDPDYAALYYKQVPLDELIDSFKHKPLQFEPGSRSEYSNAGYVILARIVEKVSGKSYSDFLRDHIFAPLGMADTGYFDQASIVRNRASGYAPAPGPLGLENVPAEDPSLDVGSGCLSSTVNDLYKWAQAVRSERFFKRTALKYPFGWGKREQYGHRYIEQSGLTPGFLSHLIVFLDEPVDVVCLGNVQSGLFGLLEKDLTAIAFGGAPDKPFPVPKEATIADRLLRGCVGLFQGPGDLRLRIVEHGGHLYGKFDEGPGRLYLLPVSEDELFMRAHFGRFRLTRDDRGQVIGLSVTWGAKGEQMKFTRVASRPKTADKAAGAADAGELRRIVEEYNRKAIEAFKKGDLLAVARQYADDATIYFPRGKQARGRKAIDQMWTSVKGPKDWKLEAIEVGGTREVIYEVGKSSLTTEVDGKESTYVCDYVVVWKRQPDGTYRVHTDIYN